MSTVAEVKLWGRTIGAVSLEEDNEIAAFEYDPAFALSGIEIAPLTMPLSNRVHSFPELSRGTYHGLPGLLADSLPDRFGNALIDAWLATQGGTPESFNAVERLCYTGRRGMGALEFEPAIGPKARRATRVQIDKLVDLASEILTQHRDLKVSFTAPEKKQALREILKVGTSAGGARAKAVIAWNPSTNEVRSGQIPAGKGFEYWLLKFDGVKGNKDKELEDPKGYGVIEYAYYKMASDAGITMSECRLFEEKDRRHFMTRRFDRLQNGDKLHMQSLCALAHYDFNLAGAYAYEQALLSIKRLGPGNWSLSPAFDMTYSFRPSGEWTATHQMTMNGKRDDFTMDDFKACSRTGSMKRGRARMIVNEVLDIVSRWRDYADEAGVSPSWRDQIQQTLRLNGFRTLS